MTIVPETKDWTWVLERRCPECGYDSSDVAPVEVAPRALDLGAAWSGVLTDWTADRLAVRPAPDRWSPLEYGCHVRDVYRRMDGRLALLLAEDGPSFPNWDQDATAVQDRYDRQDPGVVAAELAAAASEIAARFATVGDDQWARTGQRSDGARFTVATLGRYFVHDPYHHLVDIGVSPPA